MDQEEAQTLPEMWAVIELFGHQKAAGKLSTQVLGAACLLRLDVPEITRKRRQFDYTQNHWNEFEETTPAHTRFLGVGSIYAINPCAENVVRNILREISAGPIQEYVMPTIKALPPAGAIDAADTRNSEESDEAEEIEAVCQNCGATLERDEEDDLYCPECSAEPQREASDAK